MNSLSTASQSPEYRWRRPIFEPPSYHLCALCRAELRGVDFEVIVAGYVDFTLPQTHWRRHGFVRRTGGVDTFPPDLAGVAPLHDDLNGTQDSDEKHRQSRKATCAIDQDAPGMGVCVVVPYVNDDVQTQTAVSGDGFVQTSVEHGHQRFELRALSSWAKADPWPVTRWGDLSHERINAQIHPCAIKRLLNHGDNARLSRTRGAIQDDDLRRCRRPFHFVKAGQLPSTIWQ